MVILEDIEDYLKLQLDNSRHFFAISDSVSNKSYYEGCVSAYQVCLKQLEKWKDNYKSPCESCSHVYDVIGVNYCSKCIHLGSMVVKT